MIQSVQFENLNIKHVAEITRIFNYYVENSFSAFIDKRVTDNFFYNFLEMTKGYPAFAIKKDEKVIGFCFLRAYSPYSVFSETAEISYFLDKDYTGVGIGKMVLEKVEKEAKERGIRNILASISSLNINSLKFHNKNGFIECGRFPGIIKKFRETFDII